MDFMERERDTTTEEEGEGNLFPVQDLGKRERTDSGGGYRGWGVAVRKDSGVMS